MTDPAPSPAPAPTPAPAPSPTPAPAPNPAPGAPEWDGKVESLHPDVQKMIRDLRTENGSRRTALTAAEQQQQEVVRAFAKAAGIELPGDDPDPAKLTEQLTAAEQARQQAALELAVYRTAGKAGGDPDALLDSRGFVTKVSGLDPAATDFADKVSALVTEAVTANPKLAATNGPPTASGGPVGGGVHRDDSSKSPAERAIDYYATATKR